MTKPAPPNYDRTATKRSKALRERGRRLNAVLQDPAAIAELERLRGVYGSERAAIEALLRSSSAVYMGCGTPSPELVADPATGEPRYAPHHGVGGASGGHAVLVSIDYGLANAGTGTGGAIGDSKETPP